MIVEYPKDKYEDLLPLFSNHKYLTITINSILKEKEGDVFVDNIDNPQIALLSFKVLEFIVGDSENEHAEELLKYVVENRMLLFPDDKWLELVKDKLVLSPYPRTKFSSEKLSIERCNEILEQKLPEGFILEKVDSKTIQKLNPKLAPGFLPFFKTPEEFETKGLGYCIKESDYVVSMAGSSMPIHDNKFDIQAITDPAPRFRRKGFASIATAALIKESLEKGITPFWDADNEISSKFAIKLGFVKPESYTAYICSKNKLREKK
ncbi:MAG: GNAT family N-acetyltransferase [Candidatus Heimdallarchaeota archaeon]